MTEIIEIEEQLTSNLSAIQETLKSFQRSLYAFRDSQRELLLANLLNRPGRKWLVGMDLSRANLTRANLKGAILIETDLRGANLEDANLKRAILTGANLSRANLRGADLEGADLREANVDGADFTGANLLHADVSSTKNLSKATRLNATAPEASATC